MKPPPIPLVPSGLSPDCPDVLGQTLIFRCEYGHGWSHQPDGEFESIDDPALFSGEIEIIPEEYVEFTAPRCGLLGKVVKRPANYQFTRFLAFIMSDGCDFNFTDTLAPAWRIFLGDGELDLESDWFPTMSGDKTIAGYGSVAGFADSPKI